MAGYRWVRIDTGYLRNPKIIEVSTPAVMLHFASILWTGDQLTDGHIPPASIPDLATQARMGLGAARKRGDELACAGLWVPNGNGWMLHDFDVMNPQATREAVERDRERWRKAQRRRRARADERHTDE